MDRSVSKRQLADDVDDIVKDLKEKHGSNFIMLQLQLWAQMISSGNHESTDDPPKFPAITGAMPKKEKGSLADAISNAASKFTQALY